MPEVGATCAFYCWCMICGVKVGRRIFRDIKEWEYSSQTPGEWMGASLLIQGPAWGPWGPGPKSMTIPTETVKFYPANVGFERLDVSRVSGTEEIFLQSDEDDEANENDGTDADSRWYFVIHSACNDIARKVMETSQRASIRNIGDLWMTLDRRCRYTQFLSRTSFTPHLPVIPYSFPGEPVKFGLEGYCIPRRVYWEHNGYAFAKAILQWWTADPLFIPDMTASLIANLRQHKSTDMALREFKKAFDFLPQELKDKITSNLLEAPLGIQCTYIISQVYWKQAFLLIPLLWDLDKVYIENNLPDPLEGYEWDWEKITRQLLSRIEFATEKENVRWENDSPWTWDDSEVGLDIPLGLTNRRRIWQLLEDMYPNDVRYEQEGWND